MGGGYLVCWMSYNPGLISEQLISFQMINNPSKFLKRGTCNIVAGVPKGQIGVLLMDC